MADYKECGVAVAIEAEACASRPSVAHSPKHGLAAQLIEAVACIHQQGAKGAVVLRNIVELSSDLLVVVVVVAGSVGGGVGAKGAVGGGRCSFIMPCCCRIGGGWVIRGRGIGSFPRWSALHGPHPQRRS